MPLIDPSSLPYRPCVGIVLLNGEGFIWMGRRFDELVQQEDEKRWQMPQGGIDAHEQPEVAALRELYEETGVRSVEILAESRDWIHYDLPPESVGKALKGKYRGQRQKWFAMRFTGEEQEIDLQPAGYKPEFDAWRWATPGEVLASIVGFKRPAYEAVIAEFELLFAPCTEY
ncbi:MAG: RNA pyrophosphohydrolase [Rhodomicrobium sp.]|nr:RNA pyrophosphohydrolase [Rhodomicrobium sp.]